MLDQSDVSSQAAEPSSPSTDTTPGPVAQPSEPPRRELASLDEALRQTSGRPKQTTANGADRQRRNGSGQQGQSASALNSPRPEQSAGPESDRDQAAASGDSCASVVTSGDDQPDGEDDATTEERPSRRERAEVKRLAAERDQIAAERDQLRQHLTVSPEVYQAAIASRLPDDEFNRLAIKKQREDLTGDYLSADEANKLGQAIQVRGKWSLPWYLDAQKQVSQWSQAEWTRIQHDQAKAISTAMRSREYIKPDAIARAGLRGTRSSSTSRIAVSRLAPRASRPTSTTSSQKWPTSRPSSRAPESAERPPGARSSGAAHLAARSLAPRLQDRLGRRPVRGRHAPPGAAEKQTTTDRVAVRNGDVRWRLP